MSRWKTPRSIARWAHTIQGHEPPNSAVAPDANHRDVGQARCTTSFNPRRLSAVGFARSRALESISSMQTNFRAFSLLVLASMLVAVSVSAERKTEYGRKSEMRGTKVVYVESGTNVEFRDNAVKVLERELPEVTVSDRLDKNVDLILQCNVKSRGDGKGSAEMLVLARPSAPDSVRILAKYEDSKTSIWTAKLSTVLVHRFIRDYLDANPRPAKTGT